MPQTAFPKSKMAAKLALEKRIVRRAFEEALAAPLDKNHLLTYGHHPLELWKHHLGVSHKQMAEMLGVSQEEYHVLAADNDGGAFHKVSSEAILTFCKNIRVHPAHLGSLEPHFKQSLPPALVDANREIAGNKTFSKGDRDLALYALKVEKARYVDGFLADPEYGRLGEAFEAFLSGQMKGILETDELHHCGRVWVWENFAQIACQAELERCEHQGEEAYNERRRINQQIVPRYIDMSGGYSDAFNHTGLGSYAMKVYNRLEGRSLRGDLCEQDYEWELLSMVQDDMLHDQNRLWSLARMNGIQIDSELVLKGEIKEVARKMFNFVEMVRVSQPQIKRLVEREAELDDERKVLADWERAIEISLGARARTVSRLMANRLLIAEFEREGGEMKPLDLTAYNAQAARSFRP